MGKENTFCRTLMKYDSQASKKAVFNYTYIFDLCHIKVENIGKFHF